MNPLVSIIIPAYNAEDTLEKCIDSALSQKYPPEKIEVIVVNDGSKDGTNEILAKYQGKIIAINQKNLGPAGARDAGLKAARGEIICTLSSDTYASENWLNLLLEAFSDSRVGIVQGMILPCREIDIPFYHMYILKKPVWNYPTAAIAYREEAVDKAGRYFDIELSHFGDDTDLAWRILGKGYESKWLSVITAYHDVVPKTFWGNVKSGRGAHRVALLFKKRPELRKYLKLGLFFNDFSLWLNIILLFSLPFLAFANFFYFLAATLICVFLTIARSIKVSYYNKCSIIYKITIIPLNALLSDIVQFFALIYGNIKYKILVI